MHYYQGLHDVASVLLLVLGEAPAYHVLSHLATCHLRDCTRQTLDPVMELLQLLYPIIGAADPEVYRALTASGLPPFFALSWFLTWFSHTTKELADAARLFDLFLSSHPLMPLYVGAAAVLSHRAEILACDGDMPELHHLLSNLDVSAHSTIDELACAAIRLYKQAQPRVLARQHGMRWALCAAPDAVLDGSSWRVPQKDISSAQLEAARGGRKGGGGSAAATAGGGGFTDSWLAGTPGGQAATLAARMSGLLLAARGRAGSRGRLALASTLVSLTGLASAYLVAAWLALESGMAGRSAGS